MSHHNSSDSPARPLNPTLSVPFDTVFNPNYISAQRSTSMPYEAHYYPPAQEQQRNAPFPTYPLYALQNAWVPPAPANGEPEGHREDIPSPVRGVAGPGRVQDPLHFDVAYQGVVDHLQPLNPVYVFPDVGPAQGILAQAQPNDPVDLERNPFGYVPQNNAPGPVQAAFPHLFVHRVPTPNQAGAENLRRLASRYLHNPEAQVGMVSMEAGTAGRFKVVITLELNDVS
ncbi:hypothetical protein DFH94DRAFT_680642 [Russula ochroleuca]|uniref:Uncharacterized protein n=1 Tax=Russula ochroleuca TaxID=152965 RepID=A0A9P5MZR5_9AGAM|nr:hypothetical protein DFH94DRAFT_680642 [Russula ochroleuca]